MKARRWRRAGLAVLCALLPFSAATPAPAQDAARECRDVRVPVALTEGAPTTESIYGRLCVPAGQRPETIQLLVHGITYTGHYWEFPDPVGGTDRYNYAAAANRAGFATLAIDRIGSGRSSHPLSTSITIDSNAYTVHQVVQAIRSGAIGGQPFDTIVYVGHSYGTWTGWFALSRYHGVDAAVFTAAFEELTATAPLVVLSSSYPAAADPAFAGRNLDPGYLTTLPGTRDELFYEPAPVPPAVVAHDEATKSTVTATELANYPLILNAPLDIRVPVLLVAGTEDSLFCTENLDAVPPVTGGSPAGAALHELAAPAEDGTAPQSQDVTGTRLGGANCDTAAALVADEREHLGPQVPSVDAFVLPGAGHDLNQAPNAQRYFAATNEWITQTLGN